MKRKQVNTAILMSMMLFLGIFSSNAQSNEKRPPKPPTFKDLLKQMDANKDAMLSLEEVKGPLKNDFKKIDLNKDGFINQKEFDKAPKPKDQRPPKGKQ